MRATHVIFGGRTIFSDVKWTAENTATLTRLWGEGHTARYIASHIPGATRNAVIGKASRMGFERGRAISAPPPAPAPEPVRPPVVAPIVASGKDPRLCAIGACRHPAQPGDLRNRCAEHIRAEAEAKRRFARGAA